jgi:hypothetical protein
MTAIRDAVENVAWREGAAAGAEPPLAKRAKVSGAGKEWGSAEAVPMRTAGGANHRGGDRGGGFKRSSPRVWEVPGTHAGGGRWTVIDGFASAEECAAVVAAAAELPDLAQPLPRYSQRPLSNTHATADASGVPAVQALAARAAHATGVPENPEGDDVVIAHTAPLGRHSTGEKRHARSSGAYSKGKTWAEAEEDVGAVKEGSSGEEAGAGAAGMDGSSAAERWANLVNVHHDHGGGGRRACTVFVYLSDVVCQAGAYTRPLFSST